MKSFKILRKRTPVKEICPFCRSLLGSSKTVQCKECRTVYHAECWSESNGCSTFGCSAIGVSGQGRIDAPVRGWRDLFRNNIFRICCCVAALFVATYLYNTKYLALNHAAQNGDIATVEQIIKTGVDVNRSDDRGNTALMRAVEYGHIEIVRMLLKAGADPNAKNTAGWTPLWWAMGAPNNATTISLLVASGANVNEEWDGQTPLMNAATYRDLPVVTALLAAGADPLITNAEGRTARQLIGNKKIANLLKTYETTRSGVTP